MTLTYFLIFLTHSYGCLKTVRSILPKQMKWGNPRKFLFPTWIKRLPLSIISIYGNKPYFDINTAWKMSSYRVFTVRIFPHSNSMQRDTEYLSVFSSNVGKYRPEKNSVFWHFSHSEIFKYALCLTFHQLHGFAAQSLSAEAM